MTETNVFPSDTNFFLMLPYLTGCDEDLLCIRISSTLKQNSPSKSDFSLCRQTV